jgi:sigma-B regulation protein RsbU (phosphoserine phosphatase)
MFVLAVSFLAYFALLVYCDFWGPQPLGVLTEFDSRGKIVRAIFSRSPAERAGLQVGDRLIAVDGHGIRTLFDWTPIRVNFEEGRPYRLSIQRGGEVLGSTLILRQASWTDWTAREGLVLLTVRLAQWATLVLSLIIAFSRPNDFVARVGAWLLATVSTTSFLLPYGMAATWRRLPEPLGFLMWIPLVSTLALAPAVFTFFAIFPRRLFHSRLGWCLVWAPVLAILPSLTRYAYSMLYRPWSGGRLPQWVLILNNLAAPVYVLGGVLALVLNYRKMADARQKRRVRVLVTGSVVGWLAVLPVFLYWWAPASHLAPAFFMSPAMILSIVVFMAFPLSFAYAIVKHRVLEIPVLLRKSARYLLVQRGFVVILLLACLGATFLFIHAYLRFFHPATTATLPLGIALGVGFGLVLAWAGTWAEKQVTGRIDRAFFRNAYDARRILEHLANEAPSCASRKQLAELLDRQLRQSLHPRTLTIYLESEEGKLKLAPLPRPEGAPESLSVDLPGLIELAGRRQPWSLPDGNAGRAGVAPLAPLEPDCLVPVVTGGGRMAGLIVLGLRLSEEPYSGEDKRLLLATARQAGTVLESIRLAETIVEQLEAERRAAHEMEIARQVQSRLFPQKRPALRTLEYIGGCIEARAVGGDYYDYFELGSDRLALILADISGKGISAALLMANLQANLRGQVAIANDDLCSYLRSANHLFKESTSEEHYTTLFFGLYNDNTRELTYVSCGHNPALVLRKGGEIDRLESSATVLGMFDDWDCGLCKIELYPGDILAMYSDGVTEACDAKDEEFGEERLIKALRASSELPVPLMHAAVVAAVQTFSAGEQRDDLTLLVARGR